METTYISTNDTAKMIRKELKHYFPNTKFSVRGNKYSGGSSINIYWVDGPTSSEVDVITDRFQGASFDGMTDCKNYHNSFVILDGAELPIEVHFGADYVFTRRELSPEFKAELSNIAQSILNMNTHTLGQVFDLGEYYRDLATDFDFSFDHGYGSNLIERISYKINAEKVGA